MASVELDGERVLYDPVNDGVTRLDRTASLIWPFLDGTATVAELAADVAEAFGVDPRSVSEDLTTLLGQLDEAGLLAHAGDPPGRRPEGDGEPGGSRHLVDPPAP